MVYGYWNTDNWNFYTDYDTVFSTCDQYSLLGGYDIFGAGAVAEIVIDDIPTHDYLHVKFKFWSIDSWDNEKYYLDIDGIKVVE